MIGPRDDTASESGASGPGGDPWEGGGALEGLALAVLWATGGDPARDGLLRVAALRRQPGSATWTSFERVLDPFPEERGDPGERAATARMGREFGVSRADLAGALDPRTGFCDFLEFLDGAPCLVPDRRLFEGWRRALAPAAAGPAPVLDLASLAALLVPGRLGAEGERLVARLADGEAPGGAPRPHPGALEPADLHAALGVLVSRALAREEAGRAILALGLRAAWRELGARDPEAAGRLALAARLCEHPSRWSRGPAGLFPGGGSVLVDGGLSGAARAWGGLGEAMDGARPAWGRDIRRELAREPVPAFDPGLEEPLLDAEDRARVDTIFRDLLPRRFAAGGERGRPSFREGQWRVATELAACFGRRELTLVHAPTGTGKTLAYLIPTLLWAFRNGIRVGVATYTRALQEQAMEREVPVALEALRATGVTGDLRVSSLKGRRNYLCWRALKLQTPVFGGEGEEPARLLAWMSLVLFALNDPEGDLDRTSRRCPLPGSSLEDEDAWRTAVDRLIRLVRGETGCCSHREDRETCGAEVARRRAERSHVVVTNHAFALARREFFRHLVFDECEHLHDVAHNAFSHTVTTSELRELLRRLRGRRGPLERIEAATVADSPAWTCVRGCLEAQERALLELERLSSALGGFKLWREELGSVRDESDQHSLFREFVALDEAALLLDAHAELLRAWNDLCSGLAQLAEHLDTLPTRNVLRLRRGLDVQRADLEEAEAALSAWLPRREDGTAELRPETFHDLEANVRGQDVLAARVLLPHEYLGRHYYPDLRGALLISATTRLKGGFEAAAVYLGAERAAHPAEDEDREPMTLRTFEAPDAFDYRRVLVAAPRDAPDVRQGKRVFLDYVGRFLSFLAERTRGRCLALFTNLEDVQRVGKELAPFFEDHRLPLLYQGMPGIAKEELSERFRSQVESTLLGVDTFWFGADFPGDTLEYLCLVRLPYGVPDRYHHAQCAALGAAEQRRQIYMPRALAKFRQGFGRLMRSERDRGCVFLLDGRVTEPRHRTFLKELPVRNPFIETGDEELARFVTGDTDRCLREAFAHMEMGAELRRRGLDGPFGGHRLAPARRPGGSQPTPPPLPPPPVAEEDLPF